MKRSLSALFALLAFAAPALAQTQTQTQTRALPPGEIRANGDITFGNALKLGKREGGRTVLEPDALKAVAGAILPGRFWAKAYNNPAKGVPCVWKETGDAGPCIQAAINAAALAGGGEVVVDGGTYGLATELRNTTSGVKLSGAGVGHTRATIDPFKFRASTRLVWRGAAGAIVFRVEPADGANQSLHNAGVDGIVFDCNNIAAVCAKITQVSHSVFRLGAAEPTLTGIWTTTATIPDSPGTQDNDFWLYSRVTGLTNKATGIFLDGNSDVCSVQAGNCWNTSYNRFHKLFVFRTNGDGVVFGDSDNNIVTDLGVFASPGSMGGTDTVFAADRYVSPNGQRASNLSYNNLVHHMGSIARMGGFRASSTVTPGANAGTGQIATITRATTTAKAFDLVTKTLDFASVAGIQPGMSVDCGGQQSGVLPGNTVASVGRSSVILSNILTGSVASGTSCAFSYGVTSKAAIGTYTLTANSATSFTLAAPGGGNSQSGVSLSGGALTFTDMVFPFTGTLTANDKWTITVRGASRENVALYVDKANGLPSPMWEPGSTGAFSTSVNLVPASGSGGTYLGAGEATGKASGAGSVAAGVAPNATGTQAITLGNCFASGDFSMCSGPGNNAVSFGDHASGVNSVASGGLSFAFGNSASALGNFGVAMGNGVTDRGDTAFARATGQFAAQGDAQTRSALYRGVVTGTATVRLTTDGTAAGANNGLRFLDDTMMGVVVEQVTCVEPTNRSNWARWNRKDGAIPKYFGAGASYVGDASAATAPSQSGGIHNTMALTIAADDTNSVLAISVTGAASAGGASVRCLADVRTIEVR